MTATTFPLKVVILFCLLVSVHSACSFIFPDVVGVDDFPAASKCSSCSKVNTDATNPTSFLTMSDDSRQVTYGKNVGVTKFTCGTTDSLTFERTHISNLWTSRYPNLKWGSSTASGVSKKFGFQFRWTYNVG